MLDERLLETKLSRLRARVERVWAKLPASRRGQLPSSGTLY
jgi:hypothetical protein